jgi:hypothetical protein
MTVAAGRRLQAPLSQRVKQLVPQAAQLVTAARQLELSGKDLIALLERQWEQSE